MPAVIPFIPLIAAGVTATGAVVASKIGSDASKHATDAQLHASDEALDYQKQRDTSGRAEYDKSVADYKQQYAAWQNQFYGNGKNPPSPQVGVLPSPTSGGSSYYAAPGQPGPGGFGTPAPAGVPGPAGTSLADLGGQPMGGQPAAPGASPQGQSLADMGGWENWNKYLPQGVGA